MSAPSILAAYADGAGWTELAGLLRDPAHAAWEAPRVAVEADGSIVAALEENFNPSGVGTVELHVARWSGSVWEDLGSTSAGTTWAPALGVAGSTPLVTAMPSHYAYAFRWQPSAWAMLPTASLGSTYGDVVSISGDADGTIYVGVGDVDAGLTCLRLPAGGGAWQKLPALPDGVWLGTLGQTQAAYPGGGFVTAFAGQHVYVTRWTEQAWQIIDDDAGRSYSGKWPQVAVAPGGSIHVAWFEGNGGADLRVVTYTP